MDRSIVEYFGQQTSSHCGYCKKDGYDKYSHGMWSHRLTVRDYQDLIDRGWRRSGKYCYKPTMNKTCCPQYAIRCDANSFKPSKGQKKVLKRFSKFLMEDGISSTKGRMYSSRDVSNPAEPHEEAAIARSKAHAHLAYSSDVETLDGTEKPNSTLMEQKKKASLSVSESSRFQCTKACGPDPSKPRRLKAKEIRRQRRHAKLLAKGIQPNSVEVKKNVKNREKTLEEFMTLNECSNKKLTLRLVRSHPPSQEFHSTFAESHNVYWRYQTVIHQDKPDKPSEKQFRRFLCDSPLTLRLCLCGSEEFRQSLSESYALFQKYQTLIHKEEPEECDRTQFHGFLVDTPLIYEESVIPGHPGYGSFHQQYLLDGKIVAVGVIDILPECLSSKYFYYDPDFMFLSLGTYSALREIAFVRELSKLSEELRFYYMGFYVHSCPKMRYKGRYRASSLLCPEAYTWEVFESASKKLDVSKYSRLNVSNLEDEKGRDADVEEALVLYERTAMPYAIYKKIKSWSSRKKRDEDQQEVSQYCALVGRDTASRILLYRE